MAGENDPTLSLIRRLKIKGVDEADLLKVLDDSDDNLTDASAMFQSSAGLESDGMSSDLSDSMCLDGSVSKDVPLVQQLRAELIDSEHKISTLVKQHELDLNEQRTLLDDLSYERDTDRMQFEQQLKSLQDEYEELQTRLVTEVEGLRVKHRQIESQVPRLQQELAVTKDQLRNLSLPEGSYRELLKTPEDQLSLRDFVRLRAFEETREAKQLASARQSELEELRERERRISKENDRLQRLIESHDRDIDLDKAATHGDVSVLTAKCEALQEALTQTRLEAHADQNKVERYDGLHKEHQTLLGNHEGACKELVLTKAALKALEEDKRERYRDYVEREKQMELLQLNEAYMKKEAERLQEKVLELSESLARKKAKLASLKQDQQEMIQHANSHEGSWQRNTESALQQELNRLRERGDADREQTRANLKEIYERESRALRDSKDAAVQELERERQRGQEHKQAYDQLLATHRDVESKLSTQIVEARSQLKIKLFELDRVSLAYEEAMTHTRANKAEIESLNKKVEVLKHEYYKVDGDATKRNSMLEARCDEQARRIRHYEMLEKELDTAIVESGSAGDSSSTDVVVGVGASLPTDGARRIRQSIGLARQVSVLQQAKDALSAELAQAKEALKIAEAEAIQNAKARDRATQPQNYLVEVIEEKEARAIAAERKVGELEQELAQAKGALGVAEKDVARLLEERRELANLKVALQRGHRANALADVTKVLDNTQHNPSAAAEKKAVQYEGAIGEALGQTPSWLNKLSNR